MMASKELQYPEISLQEASLEQLEEGFRDRLSSSSSRAPSASSRAPSVSRNRQSSPFSLNLATGRSSTLPIGSISSDEVKIRAFDSYGSSSHASLPFRHHLGPVTSGKRAKGCDYCFQKHAICFALSLLGMFFFFDWWVLCRLQDASINDSNHFEFPVILQGEWSRFSKDYRLPRVMYGRLLGLAAHALAESEMRAEPLDLWEESYVDASQWKPCANETVSDITVASNNTGYILISANGGLNQQRVAICNGVAVAHLLNATLVLPQFLLSSVWQDTSQFGDIYRENFFIDYLKDDIRIVKELPKELQSLDLEAIGSFVSDMDAPKEAKPSFFLQYILPILLRNGVVHFYGFGNRLSFDPIPYGTQRLRCKCNFHALKFVPKIQRAGRLLVRRMREQDERWGPEAEHSEAGTNLAVLQLKGLHMLMDSDDAGSSNFSTEGVKYVGLHLRFETDMVAYSMCDFGGGDAEREELEAYRKFHFPTLSTYKNNGQLLSASQLREDGKCPLTPEEAVLMLVALGFKRGTRIFLAGAHIYGGQSRMVALTSLYPNLVTKEDLLSLKELEPFVNKSSQLAALDFIGCAAADMFAMTDSGSQLASLVSGYRMYYGGGLLPTIRPNKRRLASIFLHNMTIEWEDFQDRVRKSVRESRRIQLRPIARSVYRHPRCAECMCQDKSSRLKDSGKLT